MRLVYARILKVLARLGKRGRSALVTKSLASRLRSWCRRRRRPNARLRKSPKLLVLPGKQVRFQVRFRSKADHLGVVEFVVLPKQLALLQISPGSLGSCEGLFYLRINYHSVAQSAPFQMMPGVFSSYAQGILFKCFVELRDGWWARNWRSGRWGLWSQDGRGDKLWRRRHGDRGRRRCGARLRILTLRLRQRWLLCSNGSRAQENDQGSECRKQSHEKSIIGGRGDRIRTCDLLVPNQALYQAKLHPEQRGVLITVRGAVHLESLFRIVQTSRVRRPIHFFEVNDSPARK